VNENKTALNTATPNDHVLMISFDKQFGWILSNSTPCHWAWKPSMVCGDEPT